MRLIVKNCIIHDVEYMGGVNEDKSKRKVTLQLNEEDLFEMLDSINPKNIVKYLDMRFINHREAPVINIYDCKSQRPSERNRRKLDRCLKIIKTIQEKEKL